MRKTVCFFLVLTLLFAAACSENPPQIMDVAWQVILFENRLLGVTYQRLSVFVQGTDQDGQNDLQALHVINDEAELYWTIPSESWEKAVIRGNEWFGSNGLSVPDGAVLPVGSYRVVLEDLSGKAVETQFYVKRENVNTAGAELPTVSLSQRTISVGGNFQDPEIWVYDSNDQFLLRSPFSQKTLTVDSLVSKNNALAAGFSYYIYAKKSGVYYGVLVGPFYYTNQ